MAVPKPEAMTPIPAKETKKSKPTKWQFGIRSRNSPSEAMLAIYKALKSMGAVWEVPHVRKPGGGSGGNSPSRDEDERERRARDRQGSQSPEYSDSDPDAGTDPEYSRHDERPHHRTRGNGGTASASSSEGEGPDSSHRDGSHRRPRGRDRYGTWNDWGYKLPEDPWVINARFRKDGMFPPGVAHPSSTHSSRVDLTDGGLRRRSSTVGSQTSPLPGSATATPPLSGSAHASTDNVAATGAALRRRWPKPDESCWVYVTIQLYCIERDSFMVDFKCAGYERLIRRFRRTMSRHADDDDEQQLRFEDEERSDDDDMDEGYFGHGRYTDEKDISSPFPFMDVASSLIVSLAQRE